MKEIILPLKQKSHPKNKQPRLRLKSLESGTPSQAETAELKRRNQINNSPSRILTKAHNRKMVYSSIDTDEAHANSINHYYNNSTRFSSSVQETPVRTRTRKTEFAPLSEPKNDLQFLGVDYINHLNSIKNVSSNGNMREGNNHSGTPMQNVSRHDSFDGKIFEET